MRPVCGLATLLALAAAGPLVAQEKRDALLSNKTGAVMLRTTAGWKPQQAGVEIKPGDFLVALPDATLKTKGGAVELNMIADIGNHGSYPVLESAVTWGGESLYDVDATLHRGVIVLKAAKEKTKARIKFAGETWVFTFLQPETTIVLESYGRLSPGTHAVSKFMRDGFKGDHGEPDLELALLVLKGKVFVDFGAKGVALNAPPGPARVHWNNVTDGVDIAHIDKMPVNVMSEADPKTKEQLEKIRKSIENLNKGITPKDVAHAVLDKDAAIPKLTVVVAGALDNLDGLTLALMAPRQEVREAAIRVTRHWLGREDGQLKRFHDFLVEKKELKPVQVRNFLQLLVGFDDRERADPGTYELLIAHLTHKHIAARELAHWHLIRLTPDGNKIPFDAAGTETALEESQRRWRELIPHGKVPAPPETDLKANGPQAKQVQP
ncbi:MAG: hypothetical protein K2X38_13495 [Gemmataceae bacterium]|nr:hypothetical protein [Gemmataceae bacterium]